MEEDREVIERRIQEAKRSLSTHLAELGERIDRTRSALSVRQRMEQHPWLILGGAVAVGLLFGARGSRSVAVAAPAARSSRAPRGILSSVAHEIVRSLLASAAASVAAGWAQSQVAGHDRPERARRGRDDLESRTTGVRIYPLE